MKAEYLQAWAGFRAALRWLGRALDVVVVLVILAGLVALIVMMAKPGA